MRKFLAFSFGLLCILQATLNIFLRMFAYKFCGESALLAANHNLTSLVDNLTTENLQLRTENINLERQMENLTRARDDLNWTLVQWSLDAFCPPKSRVCQPCLAGWRYHSSRCYVIMDAESVDQKSWQEARDNCIKRNADLTVIDSPDEQTYIYDHSWGSRDETDGYWVGLTSESGRWRWVDGRNLTEEYWTTPPGDGLCATSVEKKSTFAVNCTTQKRWICEMKALNV